MMGEQAALALGPTGVIERECRECDRELPPGAQVCPVCGYERRKFAGQHYPKGTLARYQWVFDQEINNAVAKFVLLAIVHHDFGGSGIFPSHARIGAMTGLSDRSVRRAIRWLRAGGWLERERRGRKGGGRRSDTYAVRQPEQTGQCGRFNVAAVAGIKGN